MVIYDFRCVHGHVFEGWFASRDDWRTQAESGMVVCPVCDSAELERELPAPAVHLRSRPEPANRPDAHSTHAHPETDAHAVCAGSSRPAERLAIADACDGSTPLRQLVDQVRNVIEREFDDVGPAFADEARAMHFGSAPPRNITGVSSPEEERELRTLGVPVHRLRLPRFDD